MSNHAAEVAPARPVTEITPRVSLTNKRPDPSAEARIPCTLARASAGPVAGAVTNGVIAARSPGRIGGGTGLMTMAALAKLAQPSAKPITGARCNIPTVEGSPDGCASSGMTMASQSRVFYNKSCHLFARDAERIFASWRESTARCQADPLSA